MIKKIILPLLACAVLQAAEPSPVETPPQPAPAPPKALTPPQVEFKLGYFYYGDKKLRKTYGQEALDTQIAASGPLWDWIRLYGAVNYISSNGRLHHYHHKKTNIMILPVSLGVQGMVDIAHDVRYYATLGPRYFFARQHINSKGSSTAHTVGGFVNTGIQLHFGPEFFIDFYGEYSYARANLHRNYQLGGISVGAGVGCQF
jgi:hypothetical protein